MHLECEIIEAGNKGINTLDYNNLQLAGEEKDAEGTQKAAALPHDFMKRSLSAGPGCPVQNQLTDQETGPAQNTLWHPHFWLVCDN